MKTYNPDVLLCLANLSNDEVFTPPQLANEVLDLLPKEVWKDKTIKFLDPCCKTGVFLREITIRLIEGLKDEIPDLQERVNHILTHQVFGIGITELTALTSRRSLYCSKDAHGEFSICTTFDHPEGNIYYRRVEHDWKNGKCSQCGSSQTEYDRSKELETHAYAFIHKPIEELFNMKFDVIIGNPPYQLSDGGNGSSAVPLYHKFVQKAKELNPRYISMIIKSNWFTGGKGLDSFRKEMLSDLRISHLVDYPNSKECFPNNSIEGGVCYFLWDSNHEGNCLVKTIVNGKEDSSLRPLITKGCDFFIRDNKFSSILNKIQIFEEDAFSSLISARKPFGFGTNHVGSDIRFKDSILMYGNKQKKAVSYVSIDDISKNKSWVDKYKLLLTKSYGIGSSAPYQVLNKPIVAIPGTCCSETYLVLSSSDSLSEIENIKTYVETKFFRFLVFQLKNTQDNTAKVFSLAPLQDFSKPWTDAELYGKYGLTQDEIDYIESIIRPMNPSDETGV